MSRKEIEWREYFEHKEAFLWYLYNDLGCRDLKLCFSFINDNNELCFSKHHKYEDLIHNYQPWYKIIEPPHKKPIKICVII